MRRVAIILSCALAFLTACNVALPTPPPPTPTPASRQAQIAQLTEVANNLAATAESRGATATAAAVPTRAPTPTSTVARPTRTATAPPPPTAVAQPAAAPAVAQPPAKPTSDVATNLADFRIATYQGDASLGGHDVLLSNAFGYDLPVVLNFWAPLCPPCRQEMPAFQRVSDDFAGQVFFLGVDVSPYIEGFGGAEDAAELIKETGIHYPVAYAIDSPIKAYGLKSIPTTVFFTPDGKIAKTVVGDLSEAALRNNIKALLAASATSPAPDGPPPGGDVPRLILSALNALPPRADGRP